MIKPISSILFATNLSKNCAEAFDYVVSLAVRYKATIIILYVIEKMSESMESRLKGLMGQKQWEEIGKSHEFSARQALIGKRSSSEVIRAALDQFCTNAGIDNSECGYISREIVIRDGEVVQEILEQTKAYNCDLIVMGARQGILFKDTAIGPTTKNVLRKATVPVMIVPPAIPQAQ
jgi:nucleotide-binding universal stress UspA family protein